VTAAAVGRPTVLVTGGTGLVGSAIVAAMDDFRVVSLSRHGAAGWEGVAARGSSASSLLPALHGHVVPLADGRDGVTHVVGDVTRPLLGLDRRDYEELGASVDLIVHAAGVSDFTTPRDVTDALNVTGTREVLALAERAGLPLFHISTGYVQSQGTTLNDRWGAGIYIDSKQQAERVVGDSDALAAIIRPSIVFSDSRTGESPSFQGLHRIIGMTLEDKMPLLPFPADVHLDFLPRDVVGGTTAELVRGGFRGEYWLTAGSAALTFGRIVELLIDYGATLGLDLHPPRFVSEEMIERLLKPAGGRSVARRIDLLVALTSHFSSAPELPSSLPDADKGDLEECFMSAARHWATEHGYAAAPAGAGR
jgi:nucleoside-diphosphate-sugar epimerase